MAVRKTQTKPTNKTTKAKKPVKKPTPKPIATQTPTPPVKRNPWRPTKYNPEWVDTLPEMFAEGQSIVEVAVKLGLVKDTLYQYAKEHPDFSDALARGRLISQAWWEAQGRNNLQDIDDYDGETKQTTRRKFNHSLWAKNVSCRFRADWTDKQEVDVNTNLPAIIIEVRGQE